MRTNASQITSLAIVYSTVYSCPDQRKHQSSASLAFVGGIHQWTVNSPHKGPVTRKMFPFDDVITGSPSGYARWCISGSVFLSWSSLECRFHGEPQLTPFMSLLDWVRCGIFKNFVVVLNRLIVVSTGRFLRRFSLSWCSDGFVTRPLPEL